MFRSLLLIAGLWCELWLIGAAGSLRADVFKPEERVIGMLADGTRLAAPALTDWADLNSKPALAGQAVFDPARPMRWIIDQAVALPVEPDQLIEFFGGDVLPGRVLDYEPADAQSYDNPGEYLVIEPTISIDLPGQPPSGFVRVSTDWLKRIVFQRRTGVPPGYHPGTAFLTDGSQLRFRGLRWSKGEVVILTDKGVQKRLLAEIAELHLPQRDGWEVWFEQLAMLSPDLSARIVQMEASTGLRLTTSTERFRAQHSGDRSKMESWYPLLQPAWALDPLTIPFATIRAWRFFGADQPPVSILEPEVTRPDPVFSAGWNWQLHQSVQNSALRNQKLAFGWGFGVHAPTELALPLHPVVQQIHVRAGMDQIVGPGGCARAVIALSSNRTGPLWRSELLIGSDAAGDAGWINVPPQTDASVKLLLIADPAISDRPGNADPFDIRDSLDWLEPEWKLDRNRLLLEVTQRMPRLIPALKPWLVTNDLPPDGKPGSTPIADAMQLNPVVKLINVWQDQPAAEARFITEFEPAKKFVVAAGTLKIEPSSKFLAVCVSRRPSDSTPVLAQVRIGGRAILQAPVPDRTLGVDPDPILVPLRNLSGEQSVEVVLIGEGDKPRVDWRGAVLCESPPGLKRLFEDEESFVALLTQGEGQASLSVTEKQTGMASLRVSGGDRGSARFPDLSLPIREVPKLGEFRFLRFAWKKQGGTRIGLQLAHNEELGVEAVLDETKRPRGAPFDVYAGKRRIRGRANSDQRGEQNGYAYDGAKEKPPYPALRLDYKVPENWVVHNRDLFSEFGIFQLTGFGFQCPDGEAAFFDHMYAARQQRDLEWIPRLNEWAAPPALSEGTLAQQRDALLYGEVLTKVAPQFSLAASGEPLVLLAEHNGRKNVVRTLPVAQDKPCVLKAPVSVQAGKKTLLRMAVAQQLDGDWELVVRVQDQDVQRLLINADSAKAGNGWIEQELDLSRFAGQNIVLEVHNHPSQWHYEHALWHRLEIVEQ